MYPTSRRTVTLRRMPRFDAKYSDEQRDAAAIAYLDRNIRPAGRVVQLAKRGELRYGDEILEPFDITPDAVRTYASRLRKSRAGELKSGLTDAAPRDAVEMLRRRLVSAADNMLQAIERRQRRGKHDPKDPELLRQIARAAREIAALPSKDDPRPVAPGQHIPGAGANNGDRTRSGLAGSILHAHRGTRVHANEEDPRQSASTEQDIDGERSAAQYTSTEPHEAGTDDAPGAWMREQLADVGGSHA